MTKIGLLITKKINNQQNKFKVNGIKNENKITYKDLENNSKIILEQVDSSLKIKIISPNLENNMFFKDKSKTNGYFILNRRKIAYVIETKKLFLSDKKIDIEYIIDKVNKYTLEVQDD
ncbi:MAG: hypothetical protein RR404_02675 [Bacilli bacterium]